MRTSALSKPGLSVWDSIVTIAALLIACGSGEQLAQQNGKTTDIGLKVDPVIAPTDPLLLSQGHPGWKKQLCLTCHGKSAPFPHVEEGYLPPVCVDCHGYNGAPHTDHASEENPGCLECHGNVAHVSAFNAPDDCLHCHNQSAVQ